MIRISTLAALSLTPILMACQPQATSPGEASAKSAEVADPVGNPDACGATKLAKFIGTWDSTAQRAAIAAASSAKDIRWLTPGMPVTMDYRQDRLNADIAADGRYSGFNCA